MGEDVDLPGVLEYGQVLVCEGEILIDLAEAEACHCYRDSSLSGWDVLMSSSDTTDTRLFRETSWKLTIRFHVRHCEGREWLFR